MPQIAPFLLTLPSEIITSPYSLRLDGVHILSNSHSPKHFLYKPNTIQSYLLVKAIVLCDAHGPIMESVALKFPNSWITCVFSELNKC